MSALIEAPAQALPWIGYLRNSDIGNRERGANLSLDHQRESILQTAAREGVDPDRIIWLADEDATGQNFERADWQQAVEMIECREAAGLLLWNQARASRARTWETMAMVAAVEEAGGRIETQDGPVSVATFEHEVVTFMRAASDNQFAVKQGEGLKWSVTKAIERGAHLSAPYGYRKGERVESRATPIVPDDGEAPGVRLMFELRAQGRSWKAIGDELAAQGFKPRPHKRNGRLVQGGWRHQAIARIVSSRLYLGVAFNGGYETPDAHEAIVTPELFAQANAVKGAPRVDPQQTHALSGLPRCASCGYVMAKSGTSYRCQNQAAQPCPAPVTVPAAALTDYVVDQFKRDYLGRTLLSADEADATVVAAEQRVEAAAARLERAVSTQVRLASGSARAAEIADAEVEHAAAELAHAEQAHAEARAAALGVSLPAQLDADAFDALPAAEQNRWLATVYAFVAVRRDPVWRGPIERRARLVRAVDLVGDPIAAAVDG